MHWILRTTAMRSALAYHEARKRREHVVEASVVDARVDSDEERALHHGVRVHKVAHHAPLDVLERRMPQKIAAEEITSLDAVGFQNPVSSLRVKRASSRTVI